MLALVLMLAASGCVTQPAAPSSTSESALPSAQSHVPLPPDPSEQQRRVESILQMLDSELAGLLNLLPPPTTSTGAPKR